MEPEIIRNVDEHLHYCMDAKKSQWDSIGGTVRLCACHSGSNQQWIIDRSLSPSTHELKVANGMCVEPDRRTTPRYPGDGRAV